MKKGMVVLSAALLALNLCAGDGKLPKQGGICFRFDDNQSPERWRKMSEVFEKNGYRFSMAINSLKASQTPGYGELLAEMAKKGYEVMDHTPEHTVILLTMPTEESAQALAKEEYVEKVAGNKVFFKFYFDEKNPDIRPLKLSITEGKKLTVVEGKIENSDYSKYLVFPNGEIYLLAANDKQPVLYNKYGENNVVLPDAQNIDVKMAPRGAFQVDDRALALIAQRSKELFAEMNLPAPKTFITPGGWGLFPSAEQIQRVYGQKFGYAAGDQFYPNWSSNYSGRAIDRFRMSPFWNSLENQTVANEKKIFADLIAKNYVIPVISHMWLHGVNNDFNQLLQRNDEFLAWVKAKNIPVKNMAEWADILYGGNVDPESNMFPSLKRDLNEDGLPDGFALDKGATYKDGVLSGENTLFYVAWLAGFNAGENTVRVEGRKVGDAKAQGLLIFWFCDETGKQYPQKTLNFDFETQDFSVIEKKLEVPEWAAGANVSFMFRGKEGAIRDISISATPKK